MRRPRSGPLLAGLLAASFAAVPTLAEARPDTRALSCEQVRSIVQSEGAITMNTGPNSYERFVADRGQCMYMEILEPAYVPTRDLAQCFAGYRCIPVSVRKRLD